VRATPPAPTGARQRAASNGVILATLSLAAFMASLDLFIVNVAFADIGRDFHSASLSDLSWVLNGYAVLYAALLVPLGRLADRYGRLKGFLGGLALFTAASAACAAAPNLWSLIAFRGLQAVGAAALTPASLGLLLGATPADQRVRAVRIWAAIGAFAAAAGPVLGGLLVQASWRWVFIVNVPVGVLALLAAHRYVPDSRDPSVSRLPDLLGALLVAIGIGALSLALVKGTSWGWSSPRIAGLLVVAALSLGGFWARSERHPLPVVEPALLRVRTFAWSNVTALLFSLAFGAGLLAAVLWLQDVWGWSALKTGLAIAPGPLMVPIFAAVAQRLAARAGPGLLAFVGSLLFAAGTALIALGVSRHPSYAAGFLPGWLIGGVGVGFALPTIISAATADLPPSRSATGSAVVTMARQIGLVLGVSVLIAVLGTPHGYPAIHAGFRDAWWVIAAVSVLGAITGLGMTPRPARGSSPLINGHTQAGNTGVDQRSAALPSVAPTATHHQHAD
jgi:EmrB/QacA subfamily drug resistance transporter